MSCPCFVARLPGRSENFVSPTAVSPTNAHPSKSYPEGLCICSIRDPYKHHKLNIYCDGSHPTKEDRNVLSFSRGQKRTMTSRVAFHQPRAYHHGSLLGHLSGMVRFHCSTNTSFVPLLCWVGSSILPCTQSETLKQGKGHFVRRTDGIFHVRMAKCGLKSSARCHQQPIIRSHQAGVSRWLIAKRC